MQHLPRGNQFWESAKLEIPEQWDAGRWGSAALSPRNFPMNSMFRP